MVRTRTLYACSQCGATFPRWLGKCSECGGWNTLTEEVRPAKPREARRLSIARPPELLAEIGTDSAPMQPVGIEEFDRVTGGGLVAGSVILLSGEPGIGKSTLVLQVAEQIASRVGPVLYASGEESTGQIKRRAERVGVSGKGVALLATTELEDVIATTEQTRPALLIVDSVQTTASSQLDSAAGTVSQVRAVAQALAATVKPTNTVALLIGHVTKDGSLAGPKVLEHLGDTVLALESDSSRQYRLLRATKNRFGSTDEIGLFEMTSQGMLPVADPSHLFLSRDEDARVGSVVVSAVEGSRPLLFELQALVAPSGYSTPQRVARGLDGRRLAMLLAVAERRAGLKLGGHDVFVNVTGGLSIDEPAIDLGVMLALASSHLDVPVPGRTMVTGEIGLGGEIRPVSQLSRRLSEAAKLGFRSAIVPGTDRGPAEKSRSGLKSIPVNKVEDAIDWLRSA